MLSKHRGRLLRTWAGNAYLKNEINEICYEHDLNWRDLIFIINCSAYRSMVLTKFGIGWLDLNELDLRS